MKITEVYRRQKTQRKMVSNGKEEEEDLLSALPDALLLEILSLLPTTTAITTSVLSQQWHRLLTNLTTLRFPPNAFRNSEKHNVFDLIDHIITRLLTSLQIHTFHLHIPKHPTDITHYETCSSRLSNWLRLLCSLGAREIDVSFEMYPFKELIELPNCIYQCASLVTLDLNYGFSFDFIKDNIVVNLPKLKKLHLHVQPVECEMVGKLLNSCPILDDLSLVVRYTFLARKPFCLHLCGSNLKRLSLSLGPIGKRRVSIDAPNLQFFEVSDPSEKSTYTFVKPLSGLVEARICVGRCDENKYAYDKMGFLQLVCNVKKLYVSGCTLGAFGYLYSDGMTPVYPYLTNLSTVIPTKLDALVHFLQHSPNLELLALRPRNNPSMTMRLNTIDITFGIVPACVSTKIKRVILSELHGSKTELRLIHYLLENAKVLEILDISMYRNHDHDEEKHLLMEREFYKGLSRLSSYNPTCKVRFSGAYHGVE